MQQSVQLVRYIEQASATASVTRAPYLIQVPTRGIHREARAIPLEEQRPTALIKVAFTSSRIASLETPNHVAEYIIRLLSTVQLRARTCNQCRSPLWSMRERPLSLDAQNPIYYATRYQIGKLSLSLSVTRWIYI